MKTLDAIVYSVGSANIVYSHCASFVIPIYPGVTLQNADAFTNAIFIVLFAALAYYLSKYRNYKNDLLNYKVYDWAMGQHHALLMSPYFFSLLVCLLCVGQGPIGQRVEAASFRHHFISSPK